MTTTDWATREAPRAMTPERLAALVDREVERSESMLFTLTPREELDAIGRSQQLADQAYALQIRTIAAAHSRSTRQDREFASDELALALGVGMGTAHRLLHEALSLASLPGMVEAIEAGWLTQHHVRAVLRELDEVDQLTVEQRAAIGTIVLARLTNQTPHELRKLTRRLILLIDLDAARAREDGGTKKRGVAIWAGVDGQGACQGTGPLLQIEAIRASLATWLREHPKAPDDTRTESEREFDLFASLLTGGMEAGSWQAQIVVPFSTAAGGELELAEVPGLGPVLPS
ncbi:MAG: putative endonuclease, partial [Alphaproteobacteria bacterium]|nr:putative endonuclease [Alphaproteobacteria bacterium]